MQGCRTFHRAPLGYHNLTAWPLEGSLRTHSSALIPIFAHWPLAWSKDLKIQRQRLETLLIQLLCYFDCQLAAQLHWRYMYHSIVDSPSGIARCACWMGDKHRHQKNACKYTQTISNRNPRTAPHPKKYWYSVSNGGSGFLLQAYQLSWLEGKSYKAATGQATSWRGPAGISWIMIAKPNAWRSHTQPPTHPPIHARTHARPTARPPARPHSLTHTHTPNTPPWEDGNVPQLEVCFGGWVVGGVYDLGVLACGSDCPNIRHHPPCSRIHQMKERLGSTEPQPKFCWIKKMTWGSYIPKTPALQGDPLSQLVQAIYEACIHPGPCREGQKGAQTRYAMMRRPCFPSWDALPKWVWTTFGPKTLWSPGDLDRLSNQLWMWIKVRQCLCLCPSMPS